MQTSTHIFLKSSRVLVQFGGTADFSTDLKAVEVEIRDGDCHDDGGQQRDVRIASFFSPRYKVDWCKYRLVGGATVYCQLILQLCLCGVVVQLIVEKVSSFLVYLQIYF